MILPKQHTWHPLASNETQIYMDQKDTVCIGWILSYAKVNLFTRDYWGQLYTTKRHRIDMRIWTHIVSSEWGC